MSNKILVTDSLFILDEHVKQLEAAGYAVERLDKPQATEDELRSAIKGKVGYILGGIEKVTDAVIGSADELKAITFTGTAWKFFIPGHEKATQKGVAIANAPHANANAVAEWAFATMLAMTRNLFVLGRTGDQSFKTAKSLEELQIGIVGLGHIGTRLAEMCTKVGAKKVVYWNRTEKDVPYEKMELEELLQTSDVVLVCLASQAGSGWLNETKLNTMKDGAIVTCLTDKLVDEEALLAELQTNRLRAFLDSTPKLDGYKDLTLDVFYCSNETAAYNTFAANKLASDWATTSIINLLQTGKDSHKVN